MDNPEKIKEIIRYINIDIDRCFEGISDKPKFDYLKDLGIDLNMSSDLHNLFTHIMKSKFSEKCYRENFYSNTKIYSKLGTLGYNYISNDSYYIIKESFTYVTYLIYKLILSTFLMEKLKDFCHILPIDYIYHKDGKLHYVSRKMSGNLNSLILQNYSLIKRLSFAKQIIDGLCFLQSCGISHLNLKPENILWKVLENNEIYIYLSDFGAINYFKSRPSASLRGSPQYFHSPEARKNNILNSNEDVWQFGLILYYLYSLKPLDITYFESNDNWITKYFFPNYKSNKIFNEIVERNFEVEQLILSCLSPFDQRPELNEVREEFLF